jgi:hypothetical protein
VLLEEGSIVIPVARDEPAREAAVAAPVQAARKPLDISVVPRIRAR